jgi:hypothetical protein
MTNPTIARAMPAAARRDHKPTQINEHQRSNESRRNEHEPHAMASRPAERRSISHAQ